MRANTSSLQPSIRFLDTSLAVGRPPGAIVDGIQRDCLGRRLCLATPPPLPRCSLPKWAMALRIKCTRPPSALREHQRSLALPRANDGASGCAGSPSRTAPPQKSQPMPRISHPPLVLTATAIITARETIRTYVRTFVRSCSYFSGAKTKPLIA